MKIIVGLGNPGEKYKETRHNAGFMAVDFLAKQLGLAWEFSRKFNSEIAKNNDTIFVKPQTYMNNSGRAVSAIMSYYKLLPKKMIILKQKDSDLAKTLTIIHDDIDINLGKHKTTEDSRSAGHNGVQSIIDHLKTQKFKRIRIGVRTDMMKNIPADKFVLQKFKEEELGTINQIIKEIKID